MGNLNRAALAGQDSFPHRFSAAPQGGNDAETRNDNTPHQDSIGKSIGPAL
jgi:hypothetical protein